MTIEERLRVEMAEAAADVVVPAGSTEAVIAEARRRSTRGRALVAAAAVVSLIVAIAVLPDGDAPVVGTESTTSSTTTEVTTAAPETTSVPSTTSTTAPPGSAPSVFVATPDGIVAVEGFEVVGGFDLGPVMLALPDGRGGVVFQVGQSASSIMWLQEGESDEIIPAGPGIVLTLHEVTEIDGSPTVVYTARRSGPELGPEEVTEDLRLFDLDTGEDRAVSRVGGYESTALRISHAEGRFVVSMIAEGYTWFELAAGGEDGFVNPRSEEVAADDFLVWVGHGVQSPDGSTMAFMRGSPRSEAPFDFVVVDLSTGEELVALPIDGAHESTIRRLEWDGTTGLVSIDRSAAVVIRDGVIVGRLPVPGVAG